MASLRDGKSKGAMPLNKTDKTAGGDKICMIVFEFVCLRVILIVHSFTSTFNSVQNLLSITSLWSRCVIVLVCESDYFEIFIEILN